MLRYAAAAATALMLLTGVSACGGQDPPVAKPRPTRTATSPAPSPSPTPPALPAAAKEHSAASAKAFVRHYIDVLNYATFTGDVTELRRLGKSDCGSCRNVVHGITAIYRGGGHVVGGAFRITRVQAIAHPQGSGYTVDAFTAFGAQRIYRHPGEPPDRYKPGKNIFSFILSFRNGWFVSDWSRSS